METNPESILRSHFNHLKEEVNRQIADKHDKKQMLLLKEIFDYFDKRDRRGELDEEGIILYSQLAKVLDHELEENIVPHKLPMEKAGKKSTQKANRKTGS